MNRTGATGAVLDIYEQAITDFNKTIESIPNELLTVIINADPNDMFQTIQSILTHVVHSAFGYAASIHNLKGNNITRRGKTVHTATGDYVRDMKLAFSFTEKVFEPIKDDELEEFDNDKKIKSNWGQQYDIEQMMEHAIVHVLRHRRQIEKIKREKLQ